MGQTTGPFRYDLNQIPYDYTVEVRNRFKGLDLIDRVPDELWMEVRDTVQEAVIKTIPKKKKYRKAKWLSDNSLQISEKRRETKGKAEKERYTNLNVAFQRISSVQFSHSVVFDSAAPWTRAHQASLSIRSNAWNLFVTSTI